MRTNSSQSTGEVTDPQHPGQPGDTGGHQPTSQPCGLFRLLMVMIYDAIVILAILLVAGAVALELPFRHQSAGKDPAYTLYLLLAWFFYLGWCWRRGGMTLGMRAWRVRLVNLRGGGPDTAPAWWQCGVRFLAGWLSLAPAGLGYLWMLFDPEQRSWHDRLSRTRLVRLEKATRQARSHRAPEEIDRGQAK